METSDDAGIFRLRDDLAIIQTLDFFTPVVDDPYVFGQIAAANALSDVYAMGGTPLTAMNIICFPVKRMDISILQSILRGGLDKIKEADAFLVGGHSVEDDELKYGLSVTGTVHPGDILTNRGARPGDRLVLTKPIGTGIINTAIKGNLADPELIGEVSALMGELNRWAADEMKSFRVSACTDVTGFGLVGHAYEMIDGADLGLRIFADRIPLIRKTREFAAMGIVPAGTLRNRNFRKDALITPADPDPLMLDIVFDPQTSGGLLIAMTPEDAPVLVDRLREKGLKQASVIGEFTSERPGRIVIEDRD